MTELSHLDNFKTAMKDNCNISDASGSSIFSICGMALRLRDLNKWETGLPPWEENDPAELLEWIDQKEQLWDNIKSQEFSNLPLSGNLYDPFDTFAVNRKLAKDNLFYGAGYAHSLKPAFVLARIHQTAQIEKVPVIILDRELLRDLLTLPAMAQDGAVIIRRDAARLFLWDQMAYLKNSGTRFLNFALRHCGLPDPGIENRKKYFDTILAAQEQIYIYHEIGEVKDNIFDRNIFRKMILTFPHSVIEYLVRTVKDLLADTGPYGPLSQIISTKNKAGLGFYAAFQDGLFLPLFPELRTAFEKFASNKDWEKIETARERGFSTASQYARDLMDIFTRACDKEDMQPVADKINESIVQPLIRRPA